MKRIISYLAVALLLLPFSATAQSNVALNKATSQSSTGFGGVSKRIVDGNTDGNYAANSVNHTNNEANPWVQIDLGGSYDISKINIWNRTDGAWWKRIQEIYVMVSETEITANSTSEDLFAAEAHSFTSADQKSITLSGSKKGRYVRVFLNKSGYLHLAEVEVFGTAAAKPHSASAQPEWVKFEGELPENAIIGGIETNRALAVCRCNYKGGIHSGKVVDKACNIGYGGLEVGVTDFEVLINRGLVELDWVKTDGSSLPDNAIETGGENNLAIYAGRVFHENGTHPGKVFKSGDNYICNIGYGGKEITFTTFEVLIENPPHSSSEVLSATTRCYGDSTSSIITVGYIGSMYKEKKLKEGTSLISTNLKYQTRVTDDGRLVVEEVLDHGLCEDGRILVFEANQVWSNTSEKRDASLDYYLTFQKDGNLCIYSEQNGFVWCSMSNGPDSDHFEITNIGHIEVVNSHGGEVWPD